MEPKLVNIIIFIIILFFKSIKSQSLCNTNTQASKASECLRLTTDTDYCCFISPLEDSSPSYCYLYPKDKYFGYLNINHRKKIYEINCGLGSTFMDSNWEMTLEDRGICGSMNPNDYKDCNIASTEDNSCCYYEGEDMKGCYWLGIKYYGKVTKNKYTFICTSNFIKPFKFLFLLYLLFL